MKYNSLISNIISQLKVIQKLILFYFHQGIHDQIFLYLFEPIQIH